VADTQEPNDGYRNVPEEDRVAAKKFFDYAHTVAGSGNFEYAITLFIQGLERDPEDVGEHQLLREVSFKRKAGGGKPMGMMDRAKLRGGKDDKINMLNAEKMLAFDPGNVDHMLTMMQAAQKAGCYDTVNWIGPILMKANGEQKKPEFSKYIAMRDVYKSIHEWGSAIEACKHAARLRPDDMDLQTELKNLSAYNTMKEGNYESAGSFRHSVRNRDAQDKLLKQDRDVLSTDFLLQAANEAEAEYRRDPNEAGKLSKFVDALLKTERPEQENRAIDVLNEAFDKTRQFRFRQKIGQIKIAQLARMERSLREQLAKNPNDAELAKSLSDFQRERVEEELNEFKLWAENYPTDTRIRFDVASRMFALRQFGEAIPVFQQVRQDPKFRTDAGILLGRSFLEAEFVEEAVETLRSVIEEYVAKGDEKSKGMYYWWGRALEKLGERQQALKAFSQVAQWDFNYRDVQARIKVLRSGGGAPAPASGSPT
jgi:tetratricopeptide (TPR) repeat protein